MHCARALLRNDSIDYNTIKLRRQADLGKRQISILSTETSYGRSPGDPLPLETSRTLFDLVEAPVALFILQAL